MRTFLLRFYFLFVLFLVPNLSLAQDTIKKKQVQTKSKINRAADELKKSLDENDEVKIAKNYEILAEGFTEKGDNPKAEEYLKKALTSYTKLNRTNDKARVIRNLAKIQESQSKFKEASSNYKTAGEISEDKTLGKINETDAKRVSNSNSAAQNEYVKSNLELLKKEERKDEVAQAYVQKAENSFKLNDKVDAIESYKQAISYTKDKPEKVIELQNKIANVYVSDNRFDDAIAINQQLLITAQKNRDYTTQIKQMQALSEIFFKKNEPDKALISLKNAYQLATEKGNTNEVKKTLIALVSYYKSHGKEKESIAMYDNFLQNFDKIIASDTTIIDAKTFQITEDKILQLEKEKGLKDELISRKNTFNYFLIAAVLLLLLFFSLIAKALFAIKKKNKEIALQSLRREMNPHFIFNSLNSVNQFISQNKELEANKYLSSYSNLMRNMMENSNKDFVTISNEISQLKKYLDLEHLRFQDKFDYQITVDDAIDTEATFIPNMIIQPHLENAIWHGLRYMENKGFLQLKFEVSDGKINVIIDDNGIGLTKSKELKTVNQKVHESRGITNTKERIELLNDLYKHPISFSIKEKSAPQTGTVVTIDFPIINKVE
jgi:two-component system, sensor histidine kinase YesM